MLALRWHGRGDVRLDEGDGITALMNEPEEHLKILIRPDGEPDGSTT